MCFGQGCYSVPLHARPHHGRGIRDPRHRAGMRRFGAQWQPAPMCDERCGRSCTCNRQSALAFKTNRPMMTAGPRPRRRATRHAALRESAYAAPAAPKTTDTRQAVRTATGARHTTPHSGHGDDRHRCPSHASRRRHTRDTHAQTLAQLRHCTVTLPRQAWRYASHTHGHRDTRHHLRLHRLAGESSHTRTRAHAHAASLSFVALRP